MVKVKKDGFVVIGKEGSTSDGEGFGKGLYLAGVECVDHAKLLMDGPSGQYRAMSI